MVLGAAACHADCMWTAMRLQGERGDRSFAACQAVKIPSLREVPHYS